MTPPLALGEKLGFSPTFFAPQAGQRDAAPVPIFAFAGCVCPGKESFASGGSPQPPLCKGGTAWQGHAGGIVRPDKSTQLDYMTQRGSAVWPWRLATGSAVWPSGHRTSPGAPRQATHTAGESMAAGPTRLCPFPSGATDAGGALPRPWHPAPSAGPALQTR